jgi:hypothetical protein
MKLQKILINFIPIVLIFLLATYTPQFASFSQSSLGRLLAILLILFYLKLDFLTGLFVCVLVIVYYQTDYVEGFSQMLNEVKQENMENGPESEDPAKKETVALQPSQPQSRTEPLEPFSSYSPLNVDKPDNLILYDKSRQEFRKKHCQKGHLMHKGEIVKTEMSQHIFPEIKQNDFHKCNICDPSCSFEIIENYIRTEEDLMKPTSARVGGRE